MCIRDRQYILPLLLQTITLVLLTFILKLYSLLKPSSIICNCLLNSCTLSPVIALSSANINMLILHPRTFTPPSICSFTLLRPSCIYKLNNAEERLKSCLTSFRILLPLVFSKIYQLCVIIIQPPNYLSISKIYLSVFQYFKHLLPINIIRRLLYIYKTKECLLLFLHSPFYHHSQRAPLPYLNPNWSSTTTSSIFLFIILWLS